MFKFFFIIPAKAGHEVKLFSAIQWLRYLHGFESTLCYARNDGALIASNGKNLNMEYNIFID
jgi:hypothetical protein